MTLFLSNDLHVTVTLFLSNGLHVTVTLFLSNDLHVEACTPHPLVIELSQMQDKVEDLYDVDKLMIESLVHSIHNEEVNKFTASRQ